MMFIDEKRQSIAFHTMYQVTQPLSCECPSKTREIRSKDHFQKKKKKKRKGKKRKDKKGNLPKDQTEVEKDPRHHPCSKDTHPEIRGFVEESHP